ncbi:MAG: hypothetical protein JSS86_18900, partial [Cyanobacteria bacterium SZAS LIN-2]|nr:hypothetical protein [Cyanobacteria bacterium SZAS LIN-2]
KVKPYPMTVPEVDLYWIFAGPLTLIYALFVAFQCKSAKAATPSKPQPAPAAAAST